MKRPAIMTTIGSSLAVVTLVAGCGAGSKDDSVLEEDSATTTTEEALSTPCSRSRTQILAATSGGRRRAIERGFVWLDANVPYSQSKSRGGYRTDCSGFVSMCWELGQSYTTADFSTGG